MQNCRIFSKGLFLLIYPPYVKEISFSPYLLKLKKLKKNLGINSRSHNLMSWFYFIGKSLSMIHFSCTRVCSEKKKHNTHTHTHTQQKAWYVLTITNRNYINGSLLCSECLIYADGSLFSINVNDSNGYFHEVQRWWLHYTFLFWMLVIILRDDHLLDYLFNTCVYQPEGWKRMRTYPLYSLHISGSCNVFKSPKKVW